MDPDSHHIDLRGAQGAQVGDGNLQINISPGAFAGLGPGAYLEQVRQIAPPELRDRGQELAELARFCTDSEAGPYAWWRAGPWAGKTALLSTFVASPPVEVAERAVLVSFFITARLAAQETREAFTGALLDQLAALLGERLPQALRPWARETLLLELMTRAARACQEAGRRLVLVVDGLDEDRGVTAGPEARSIAALLPGHSPAGMRVIVGGRPDPVVPDDVPDWHPLRDPAIVRPLTPSAYARDLERLSGAELQDLLRGSELERDLVGLLAAARGGLTSHDLAHLAGAAPWEVLGVLQSVTGRTFTSRPSLSSRQDHPDVYLLGHEKLQALAEEDLSDRLAGYRDRLHAWADEYRARTWPPDTPEYLMSGYYALLDDLGDLDRMTGCALDWTRHARMLDLTGGDGAALAETRAALERIAAQDRPDLERAIAVAFHRDRLAQRIKMPSGLPAVWAALGNIRKAIALATSISEPVNLNHDAALSGIAGALADIGEHQQAEGIARSVTGGEEREKALAKIAGALARAGKYPEAEAMAGSATSAAGKASALIQVARALTRAGQEPLAASARKRAEDIARSLPTSEARDAVLASLAEAVAEAGQYEQATLIARSITDYPWRQHALAQVAEALAVAGQYEQAEDFARTADDFPPTVALSLARVAVALVAAGHLERAETIARSIPRGTRWSDQLGARWQAMALARIGEALTIAGRPAEARAAIAAAEDAARSIVDRALRADARWEVVGALAVAGQHERAEELAGLDEPGLYDHQLAEAAIGLMEIESLAGALTATAMRLALAGQHQMAISIAQRAEAIARSQVAPGVQSYDLAEVIVALAEVGEYEKAESLASSLTDPYWKARAQAAARSGSDMAVEALARAGEYRRAETVADSMIATDLRADAPARDRSAALTRVARALAETGQFPKAEEIARSIDLGYFRGQALAQVAEALAAAGQRAEAEVMAHSITEPNWWQSRALARIAREFARAGDADGAARVATAACAAGRWTLAVESMLRLIPSAPEKLERLMRDQ